MRRGLNTLYTISGAIAASSIGLIMIIVLSQVTLNFVDWILARVAGQSLGLLIPSYATFSGYALASATFFGLGYTLRKGGHIRVTLIVRSLPDRLQRFFEALTSLIGAGIGSLLTFYMIEHAYDAWRFGDMSFGLIAVPLWMPQCILIAGSAIFTIACLDTFAETLACPDGSSAFGEDDNMEAAALRDASRSES